MKRIASIGVSWGNKYGQPAKTPEQLARDMQRVREILERMGYGHEFSPERKSYDFKLEVGSKVFDILVEELQEDPHLAGSHNVVVRYYTHQELESAELLIWGPTNQAIEDDYYTLYRSRDTQAIGPYFRPCPACGAPLEQARDLMVDKRKMGKRDLSLTYLFEIILSERLAQLFEVASLTGFELRPVRHYRKPYKGEPNLFQLIVNHTLPPMAAPPTEFERVQHCETCGTTARYLKRTHWWGKVQYYEDANVYYPRDALRDVCDFNCTAERFGELRDAHGLILISQQVYRLLLEHKIKGWAAVPVYLVD